MWRFPLVARIVILTAARRPYRALESILLSVQSALEAEMVFIRHLVGGLLSELEDDIDRDKFKRLLHYSRRLTNFHSRAKLVSLLVYDVPRSFVTLTRAADK